MKKPLIVLTGPTAAGKTHLSISLAKAVNGEIISADSMQVYKYMDIGSAKIRPSEMQGVKHYLVDELLPEEEFHIVRFQQMAKAAMEEIYAKGKIPILVGGTGFYIQAITRDIDFTQAEQEDGYRQELEKLAAEKGNEYLHEMLLEVDPVSAKEIHANNAKRVIRALEFYHQNHSPISAHNQEQKEHETPYNLAYFVLNVPRELLYKRIDDRIDEMLNAGLLEEVQKLKDMGKVLCVATSKPENSAKEVLDHFDLTKYFDFIGGDTPDHARKNKTAVINFVMESMGIENKDDVIMVGDTQYDVLGADESGIKCIGVLYGYGQKDKLEEAGAYILAEKPSDIAEMF